MPAGKYYRRGHWVTKPTSKKAKGSGWIVAAALAALAWFWTQGSDQEQPATQQPAPAVSQTIAPAEIDDAASVEPPMPSEPPLPSEGP